MLMLQILVIIVVGLLVVEGTPPPGFQKPHQQPDKNPPKYEYGYNIADEKGDGQGKLETRNGEHAHGRYYVQGSDGAQNVQYFADDWGYHPIVKYNNANPHSRARAYFALGEDAVNTLKTHQEADVSANEQIQEAIEKINEEKAKKSSGGVEEEATTSVVVSTGFTDPSETLFTEEGELATTTSKELLDAPTLVSPEQVQAQDKKDDEVSLAHLERVGGYGSKLNSKFRVNGNSIPNRRLRPSKLAETASKMVSGQDVLDINKAIGEGISNASASPEVASSNQETTVVSGSQEQISLSQQPIVVADFETQNEPAEDVLVTPRPTVQENGQQNFQIEVQKSQPFYLGKFEYMQYPSGYSDEKMIGMEGPRNMTAEKAAMENIQLGTALLSFPVPEVQPTQVYKQETYAYEKPGFVQLLPQQTIKQQFAQDIETNDITVQQLPATVSTIQFKAPLPLQSPVKYIEKPFEITRYVNTPIHFPYPVEKRVPTTIQKPYTITKYIERPYPAYAFEKQPYTPLPSIAQPFYIQLPFASYPKYVAHPTESVPQLVTIPQSRPLYQPQQDQKPADTQQIPIHYTPMPTRTYLPPPDCDQDGSSSTKSLYYAGLLPPPRFPAFRNLRPQQQQQQRYRNVRSDFGKNLRLEYGFLPPMVPSLEIDEYGNPIDKRE